MRTIALVLAMACLFIGTDGPARAQTNCKICADQQKACMKNYAGPACSTEYRICMKACKK